MPKLVLVEFDDDTTADEFIKRMFRASKTKKFRIQGVFKKPSQFCSCGPIPTTMWPHKLARGPVTGWYIHTDCGLPRRSSFAPRNIWPDLLNKANRKRTLSENIQRSYTLSMVDGDKLRPNYPLQGPTDGPES
jgi:hypothetical protein